MNPAARCSVSSTPPDDHGKSLSWATARVPESLGIFPPRTKNGGISSTGNGGATTRWEDFFPSSEGRLNVGEHVITRICATPNARPPR